MSDWPAKMSSSEETEAVASESKAIEEVGAGYLAAGIGVLVLAISGGAYAIHKIFAQRGY